MSVEFNIKFDSDSFTGLFENDLRKAHVTGLRQGLNKTANATKKIGSDAISDIWNMKKTPVSRIKKDYHIKSRARGNDITSMKAEVFTESKRGVSLLRFASDTRVIQMRRKSPGSRNQIDFEIIKGKQQTGKGAFVQFGRGNQKLVFRNPRTKQRRYYSSVKSKKRISSEIGIQAQHAPSFTAMLQYPLTQMIFEHDLILRRDKEVAQAIEFNLKKIK